MVAWVPHLARFGRSEAAPSAAGVRPNLVNRLTLFIFSGCLCACSADLTTRHTARIAELERYTGELEGKLTALKEQALRDSRTDCSVATPPSSASVSSSRDEKSLSATEDQASVRAPSEERTASVAPEGLRVVRLSPTPTSGPVGEPPAVGTTAQGEPTEATSELAESADGTRPVLKLHGAQEGKVYLRSLTAADKEPGASL